MSNNYKTVLDQVDPEVAKMLDAPSMRRRFSFNEDGTFESNLLDIKSTLAHVSYTASTGGPHDHSVLHSVKLHQPYPLASSSIGRGIASRHPQQDSFLNKFASVADATRDLELSSTLSSMSFEPSKDVGRRTSFNSEKTFNISPHGSMNENLNIRNSRHQSISEKIDNINNSSPVQANALLSTDLNSNQGPSAGDKQGQHHNFWNPATATSFTPQSFNYFLDPATSQPPIAGAMPPMPFNRAGPVFPPMSPPPFMMGAPPPFMDGNMYPMMTYGSPPPMMPEFYGSPPPMELPESEKEKPDDADVEKETNPSKVHLPPKGNGFPSVGLMNRQMHPGTPGFVFPPFTPFMMYSHTPPPTTPPNDAPIKYGDQKAHNGDKSKDGKVVSPKLNSASPSNHKSPQSAAPVVKKGKGKGAANAAGAKQSRHIHRSPLLEEVRSNTNNKEYYLKDICDHVVEFTKDQHGSRFIQQRLPTASEEEKEAAFNEIRDIAYELMTDVFGNYVIQKFFEHGSPTQQAVLLQSMKGKIYSLSLQMYGCRVVQRALEFVSLDGQLQIVLELKEYVLICAKDQNGNHVIQKSIECVPFEEVRFILDSLDEHIYHLSTHPYGCRVIQRLLEFSTEEDQKYILGQLKRFIFYLIQDQYGNYVIQHVLEHGKKEDREDILEVVLGSIVNFSKHKFASNVIEKCIKHGTVEQRKRILHEVMLGNEDLEKESVDDDSSLALMMKDQYANYVIQKLVEGFDPKRPEKKLLVVKLRQYLKQLSMKNNYGKHLALVEKMIAVAESALLEADRS